VAQCRRFLRALVPSVTYSLGPCGSVEVFFVQLVPSVAQFRSSLGPCGSVSSFLREAGALSGSVSVFAGPLWLSVDVFFVPLVAQSSSGFFAAQCPFSVRLR